MIKNYLLIAALFFSFQLFSQESFFLVGSNITKYTFKSSDGIMTTPLQSGSGSSYEMGYSRPIKNEKLFYNISITLNDYNAVAGSPSNSYKWNTKYLGFQNAVSFKFPIANNFQLVLNGGLNISTIIYGKQELNSLVYDLIGQDEFKGVLFSPLIGSHLKYKLNDFGYLSVGYNFSKSFNPFNASTEKLSFSTNQILFGIHFNMINK